MIARKKDLQKVAFRELMGKYLNTPFKNNEKFSFKDPLTLQSKRFFFVDTFLFQLTKTWLSAVFINTEKTIWFDIFESIKLDNLLLV